MVRLTVSFQGNLVKVHEAASGVITIGQDPDNTLCIEAPDIAPKHAIIDLDHPKGPQLLREDERFLVEVNGVSTARHLLVSGDIIRLGQHILYYADTRTFLPTQSLGTQEPSEASLQLLNGKNIGRVIPLKRALTRLGNHDSVAVIARRKDGYFLSSLAGDERIKINGYPLKEQTVQLKRGDKLEIDNTQLLFHV
ncbi:MAG: FHA domain-containing protein [Methylohalobius sp.]|nr:FHA domain-containing protein [Methylohalobius sp.]